MLNHNASDNFPFLVQLRKPILITLNLRIADKGVLWLFFFSIKIDVAFLRNQLLSFCFSIKDKTEFPHKHDQVYRVKCPEESCNDDYVTKTARRI